ncbi:MAG: SMP-30/gluconolactonase/LRE family protein [Alphaproteobacteria bacterium]|nr:SMP-30/gluconolactonase/LRE family protein [Alphaproteobacteria bacterium]
MTDISIDIALDTRSGVGESPIWDAKQQALFWVDITGKSVHRYDPSNGVHQAWKTNDFPVAIAITETGNRAIVAQAQGIGLLDFDGLMTPFANPDNHPGNRLNEGKCDPAGRLWVGSMQTNLNPDGSPREMTDHSGALFRIDPDGGCTRFSDFSIGISNTMAWSPDGKYFYFGDSLAKTLFRYDYDHDSGRVDNRTVLFQHDGDGFLDGSCIDDDGCLWNARFTDSKLLRITPQGNIDRVIALPVTNPTSCTFGGPDGRTLYVTSARFLLSDAEIERNPHEGAVLALQTQYSGPADHRFAGPT